MPVTNIKIHALVFRDALFCNGLNATIRKGTKWAGLLELGDAIKLISSDGCYLGAGEVRGIWCMPYNEVPFPSLIGLSTCDTKQELDQYMTERYPSFKEEELISVIFFKVIEYEHDH